MKKPTFDYLIPNWPAPDNVKALVTLRSRGDSSSPFDCFNLASHVGDNPQQVAINRKLLVDQLNLKKEPIWLNQIHGTTVIDSSSSTENLDADGCFSDSVDTPCVILTADCLPVLLCNQQGTRVAAVHAGWRGLCEGIIGKAINQFDTHDTVLAYLGPAISAAHFEVGSEVLSRFLLRAINETHRVAIEKAFTATIRGKYLADLYALARAELEQHNVDHIYGGSFCSFSQAEQFYSYRRNKNCGRNASLIWLKS
jgi:YfiH family protein